MTRGMANILVDSFASVFEGRVPPASASSLGFDGVMANIEINMEKVYSVLTKLDVGSAMGPDCIHPRLLRECAVQLASPLTMIFKSSLMSGVLPGVWLESEGIPLFKAESRYDAENYRPVSHTSWSFGYLIEMDFGLFFQSSHDSLCMGECREARDVLSGVTQESSLGSCSVPCLCEPFDIGAIISVWSIRR